MSDVYAYNNTLWKPYMNFTYTGQPEEFTLTPGKYLFICKGAKGGRVLEGGANNRANPGGITYGILNLPTSKTMYAVVGGNGGNGDVGVPGVGGYNGGGDGGKPPGDNFAYGAGGGGATDVRLNLAPDEVVLTGYKTVPDACEEVTYLTANTFSGMYARIDTGVVHKSNTRIECIFKMYPSARNNYEVIFGARNQPTEKAMVFFCRFNGEDKPTIGCNNAETRADFTIPRDQILKVIFEGTTATVYDENGDEIGTIESTGSPQVDGEYTMGLFQQNNSNSWYDTSMCTIYSFKMWNDGELVRHMIPVKMIEDEVDVSDVTFTQGELNNSTGVVNPSANNYVTSDFIEWPVGGNYLKPSISITSYTPYWKVCFYDKNQEFIRSTNDVYSNDTRIRISDYGIDSTNVGYIRISIKGNMDAPMSPTDVLSFTLFDYAAVDRNGGMYDVVSDRIFVDPSGYDLAPSPTTIDPKTEFPIYEMLSHNMLSRIIVAGGGGGAARLSYNNAGYPVYFGVGGGAYGGLFVGRSNDPYTNKYASQNSGYSFGKGMTPPQDTAVYSYGAEGASGGGGGWYGGYAVSLINHEYNSLSGGGGSGYILTADSYKPTYYEDDTDIRFTDTLMIGGMSEQPELIICKESGFLEVGDVIKIPCTGKVEHFILPKGEYVLKCWGNDGGVRKEISSAGRGGYSEGTLTLDEGTDAFVRVGGTGIRFAYDYNTAIIVNPSIAFNGGGPSADPTTYKAAFGGGATDIRLVNDTLYNRVMVAGGAGGHGSGEDARNYQYGGHGGGTSGANPRYGADYGTVPGPGTQTGTPANDRVGGAFGIGGNGLFLNDGYGGAGGAGWYGGSGCIPDSGSDDDKGGAGGSGYVLTEESYKPEGYALDSKYYLTDTYMATGDGNHEFGIAKAEIIVNDIAYLSYLCRDAEGLKGYDKTLDEWVYISQDEPTPTDFLQHNCSKILTLNGLVGDFTVFIYDPTEFGFTDVTFTVIPNEQIIQTRVYTENLLKKYYIDADVDEDTTDFEVSAIRKGTGEGAYIEFKIKVKLHRETEEEPRMYCIIANTQGKISYSEPHKKEKTLEHIDLLPVGSATRIPTTYRPYIGGYIGQTAITSVQSSALCEHNRMIYSVTVCNSTTLRFTKLNLMTNQVTVIRDVPKSAIGNYNYGGILVDDQYMYITSSAHSTSNSIWRIPLDPNDDNITYYSLSGGTISCYGKIQWFGKNRIIARFNSGYAIFDTIRCRWETIFPGDFSDTRGDFAVGTRIGIDVRNAESRSAWICDVNNKTWYGLAETWYQWDASVRNCVCYGDGNFYATQTNYLYIFSEQAIIDSIDSGDPTHTPVPVRRIVAPYQSYTPRTINYDKGMVYITIEGSVTMYIYDIENDRFTTTSLPFAMSNWGNDSIYRPFSFMGNLFIGNMNLYVGNFVDYAKYALGYKYDQFVVITNGEHESEFTYNEKYVSFRDSYLTIHKGDIDYPIEDYDPENNITKFDVTRSEFDEFISMTIVKNEEEEEDVDEQLP